MNLWRAYSIGHFRKEFLTSSFEPFSFWIVGSLENLEAVATQWQWQGHLPNRSTLAQLEQLPAINNWFVHPGMYKININPADNKNNWK